METGRPMNNFATFYNARNYARYIQDTYFGVLHYIIGNHTCDCSNVSHVIKLLINPALCSY